MPVSNLRQDLVLWMVVLRRITLAAGIAAGVFQCAVSPAEVGIGRALAVLAAVCLYNEVGRLLVPRVKPAALTRIVNAQVALDTLALVALVHLGGGVATHVVFFFAPLFFACGAVLPLGQALAHAALAFVELVAVGVAEATGALPVGGFAAAAGPARLGQVVLMAMFVSLVSALCTYLSRYLSVLLREQEERSSALATERGALLEHNERATARIRALLDVAQHVSGNFTIEALLRAVCDTTVAMVKVPRVEIFLWDPERNCLDLAAARGLVADARGREGASYRGDLPIVARLRAGEVVDFGAALLSGVPVQRAFAAPMMYRGTFEGALFVGYAGESADELMELVQGIARQAALALANVRAIAQQQEDADVSRVLLQLSQGLSACLDEEPLWSLLVRGACDVLEVPWSIAFRFDEERATFRVADAAGVPERALGRLERGPLRLENLPLVEQALSGRSLMLIDDPNARLFADASGWPTGPWLAIPFHRGGWVAGFLAAGTNPGARPFTARQRRLADGLGHHASIALQNARLVTDLEAADRLKSEFVSTMSHELRTPLNVIIGYTEMLRDGAVGDLAEPQVDLVDRLGARGRELLELIEATLHVGRLEAGRDVLEMQRIPVADLLRALQASTAGLPRPPGVEVRWDVVAGEGRPLVTDRAKIALVVRNLVSNALKFTAAGEVVVQLGADSEGGLLIEVRDTGIGIDTEHLPIIFDMFRQVDGSMTRRHGGVGLGLYIVKQFVTRLGGTVDVASTPGSGSRFRVLLPTAFPDEPRVAA